MSDAWYHGKNIGPFDSAFGGLSGAAAAQRLYDQQLRMMQQQQLPSLYYLNGSGLGIPIRDVKATDIVDRGKSVGIEFGKSKQEKEKNMFGGFKAYVQKHGDLIWTIVVVAIADHFLLKGALRTRIHEALDGFLAKMQGAKSEEK